MNELNARPRILTALSVLSRMASVTKPVHCVHNILHRSNGGNTEMDMLAHCRAMAAFCRQRASFEDENDAFWIGEAEEWDKLISEYAALQPQISAGQTARGKSASADDRDDAKLPYILPTQMQSTANRSGQ